MAGTLTTSELLAKEVAFLDERKRSLDTAIKASESRLKDVRAGFDLAEVQAKQDLDNLKIEQEKKRAALQDLVGPLQGQIDALRLQVLSEQNKLEAIKKSSLTILDDRQKQLATLDAAIATKQKALDSVTGALNSLKTQVGAL